MKTEVQFDPGAGRHAGSYILPTTLRGHGIYAVGKKLGPIQKRYPAWLYEGGT